MPKATLSLLPKFRLPAAGKSETRRKKKPLLESTSAATHCTTTDPPPPSYDSLYLSAKTGNTARSESDNTFQPER